MKKYFSFFLAGFVCMLLSSCVPEFVNPLVNPQNNLPDSRLLGEWILKDKKETDNYILFLRNPGGDLICKTFEKDSEGKNREEEISCIPSIFEEDTFLSIKLKEVNSGETSEYYYIIKYEIREETLSFYHFKNEVLVQAIKDNKIKGRIQTYESSLNPKEKEKASVHEYPLIEETSENLIRFIKSMKKEELFEAGDDYIRRKALDQK